MQSCNRSSWMTNYNFIIILHEMGMHRWPLFGYKKSRPGNRSSQSEKGLRALPWDGMAEIL